MNPSLSSLHFCAIQTHVFNYLTFPILSEIQKEILKNPTNSDRDAWGMLFALRRYLPVDSSTLPACWFLIL